MVGFLGFLPQEAHSQMSGKILYQAILETDNFKESESVLIFNNEDSYFYIVNEEGPKKESKSASYDQEENVVEINIESAATDKSLELYINREKEKIIRKDNYFKNGSFHKCRVYEPTGSIKWIITDETKTVGIFEAVKATTDFRGRNYTAWFAPDLPVGIGPWIFHGLPGLILELYDDDMHVQFYMSSIKIPYELEEPIIPPREGKLLSLEEYVAYEENFGNEFLEMIKSKLPRGAVIGDVSYKETRRGIELEY